MLYSPVGAILALAAAAAAGADAARLIKGATKAEGDDNGRRLAPKGKGPSPPSGSECGDGIVDGSEQCDGAAAGSCEPGCFYYLGCDGQCRCALPPAQGPDVDLRLTAISWGQSGKCGNGASRGDNCEIDYTVQNAGADTAYGRLECQPWSVCYYLVKDAADDCAGGTRLGCTAQNALAGNASRSTGGGPNPPIPSALDPGFYYLCGVADAGGDVAETDESNNSLAVSKRIRVQ